MTKTALALWAICLSLATTSLDPFVSVGDRLNVIILKTPSQARGLLVATGSRTYDLPIASRRTL